MLSQRRRRLSVLSSTCQHVATLQFVSGAETNKFRAFSRPHPCFLRWRWDSFLPWKAVQRQRQIQSLFPTSSLFSTFKVRLIEIASLPWKACPPKQAYVYSLDISVFLWLRKQRPKIRARSAQGYFRMKDVDRRIAAIAQVNIESKEEKVERAEFNVPTCGHIAVCQRCRDKQIQSLFPTSSLFSTLKVRLIEIAGLPWKACPPKQAYVYSLDISVFLWLRKQRPKIRARLAQGYLDSFVMRTSISYKLCSFRVSCRQGFGGLCDLGRTRFSLPFCWSCPMLLQSGVANQKAKVGSPSVHLSALVEARGTQLWVASFDLSDQSFGLPRCCSTSISTSATSTTFRDSFRCSLTISASLASDPIKPQLELIIRYILTTSLYLYYIQSVNIYNSPKNAGPLQTRRIVCFSLSSIQKNRFVQGQPKAIFEWKTWIEELKLLLK